MKTKHGRTVWFQRWMGVGLIPIANEGYALGLAGVAGSFGLSALGDRLQGAPATAGYGALCHVAAFAVVVAVYLLALSRSAVRVDR